MFLLERNHSVIVLAQVKILVHFVKVYHSTFNQFSTFLSLYYHLNFSFIWLYNTFFINGILDPIIGGVMNSVSLSKWQFTQNTLPADIIFKSYSFSQLVKITLGFSLNNTDNCQPRVVGEVASCMHSKWVIRICKSKKNRQHNGQKDNQRSTKHTHKTTDRVTQTTLNAGGELRCPGRVGVYGV
jgi:hypothetical protein